MAPTMAAPISPSHCSRPKNPTQKADCLDYDPARLAMHESGSLEKTGLVPDAHDKMNMGIVVGTVGVVVTIMLIISIILLYHHRNGRIYKESGSIEVQIGQKENGCVQQRNDIELHANEGHQQENESEQGNDRHQLKDDDGQKGGEDMPDTLDHNVGMILFAGAFNRLADILHS